MVHRPTPTPTAMNSLEAKVGFDREWTTLQKGPAWDEVQIYQSSRGDSKTKKLEGKTVHVSTFMDWCHLKNCELENKFQKYKARAALRSDTVKNDSGNYVVFTGHGASASHMTVAKVLDVLSKLPGCCGQTSDAVTANSQVEMKDPPELLHLFSKEDCPKIF